MASQSRTQRSAWRERERETNLTRSVTGWSLNKNEKAIKKDKIIGRGKSY